MKTNDIRRVIDATLAGMKLTPQQRADLAARAMREEAATPPRRSPGPLTAARRTAPRPGRRGKQ